MKRIIAFLAFAALAGSTFAQGKLSGNFTFGGSTTVAPIAYPAIEAFSKDNPGVKISYEVNGSGTGIKQVGAGVYSLAGSSRELTKAEEDSGLVPTVVALDGLSVVVNKDIKLANIGLAQLAKVYSGEITNWKDVGGADAQIQVINRDETSGTYAAFLELVVVKALGSKAAFTKNAIVAKENGEVAAKVVSTPNAIGYVGMAFVDQVVAQGGKSLMVDGVKDTQANVVAKKYPISRSLFLVTKGTPAAGSVEKAFIDFVLSPKGQSIVKSVDYIPLPKN